MSIKYFLLSIFYKKIITTEQFKKIIKSYIDNVNSVAVQTVDYMDKNNDGYISVSEIVYLMSTLNKRISKMIKGIK